MATKKVTKAITKTTKKPKFDTSNYVFETPIEKVQEWLDNFDKMCNDPETEWPSQQEQLLYCILKRDIETCRQNGENVILLNAIENKVCGFYSKSKRGKK